MVKLEEVFERKLHHQYEAVQCSTRKILIHEMWSQMEAQDQTSSLRIKTVHEKRILTPNEKNGTRIKIQKQWVKYEIKEADYKQWLN